MRGVAQQGFFFLVGQCAGYWLAVEDRKDCVVAGDWLGHVLLGQCHCSQLQKLCDEVVIVMAVECKVYCRGGTDSGAGGAIAPPFLRAWGHSPAPLVFNECGKGC